MAGMLLFVRNLITDLPVHALRHDKAFQVSLLLAGQRRVLSNPFAQGVGRLNKIIEVVTVEVLLQPSEYSPELVIALLRCSVEHCLTSSLQVLGKDIQNKSVTVVTGRISAHEVLQKQGECIDPGNFVTDRSEKDSGR